ncbi:MAG TPA: hypothetical protein VMT24_12985, partial [Aggregatilineaceae bacterium]|nr:hypothetical protein [Aggregatilineaceae bacterium]
ENIANLTLQETILTGGVQAFVRRRLARIPTDASPLLRLAALTGRELDLKVLRTLDPRIDLQRWVTLCADAAVLEASGEQWRFAHDKLRETLVSEVPAGIRANLHEQIARAIETVYLGAPEYASSLTYQWLQAGDNAKTIHYAALAGEQALSSGAYKEAIGFLERALNLSAGAMTAFQAASTEYQLGMAYYGLANLESSQAHMLQALSLLGWHMPATQAQLYTTLVKELVLQLVRLTRRFENYARHPRGELLLASRISSHLTQIGFFSGSMAPSALHTVRSANIAEAAGVSPELARSHAHLTLAISLIPFNRLAQYYSYRSVKVARAVGQPSTLAYSLYITGFYHYTVGHWAQAHASLHEAIDMLTEIGDGRRWREAQANLGYMLGLQGKFAESFAVRANLEMVAQRDDDVQARGWGIAGMGEMSLWLHHSDDALRYLQARIDLIDQFTDVMDPTTPCVALLALAFWRAGQPEKARPQAALGLQHMALLKNGVFHSFHGFASLAEVYLRMWEAQPDDHELAQVARRVTMALRTFSFRFPVYQAWSWRNYGMYLWLAGQPRRARVAWQQSMAVAVRLSLPYDEGLVRYEIGRHLATDDPRRHDELRRAADIFASLDAAYDLAQVQAALAADDGH